MYPASRESNAFGVQAMMRSARTVPNKLARACSPAFLTKAYDTPVNCCVISIPRPCKLEVDSVLEARIHFFVQGSRTREHNPRDASKFVRQRYHDLVVMHPALERIQPSPEPIS